MSLTEDDDMVRALTADGSDQPFGDTIIKGSQLHLVNSMGENLPGRLAAKN